MLSFHHFTRKFWSICHLISFGKKNPLPPSLQLFIIIFVRFLLLYLQQEGIAKPLADQILVTIYGQCVGDALGLLTEFMCKEEAKKVKYVYYHILTSDCASLLVFFFFNLIVIDINQ